MEDDEARFMAEPDPGFERELDAALVGGRERREVRIVDYSPQWPVRFDVERERIQAAVGSMAHRIEHIGSTSVPGLAAKPVIDIMVTVDDPEDEALFVPAMEAAGYVLRVREPGHRMFRTPERDVHVHFWRRGSDNERRDLLFRDRLRADRADREEYERVKRSLAREWPDTNYYARAKTAVVESIIERAEHAEHAERAVRAERAERATERP